MGSSIVTGVQNCIVSSLNLAPVSRDMAALRTLFAASMVAVWSAASGNFLASKKDARFIEHSYGSNMSDGNRSGEQDAMKEVSGTGKGLLGNVEHLVDKEAYHIAKKSEPFILHNENRSGEQDAMKEVSGTSGGGLFGFIGSTVDKTIKAAWHATKKAAHVVSKGVEKTWKITKKTAGLGAKGVEGGYKMGKKILFGGKH